MGKTILIMAAVVLAFYAILIATKQAKNPFAGTTIPDGTRKVEVINTSAATTVPSATTTVADTITCTVYNNIGNQVVIRGSASDPEFQKLCLHANTQTVQPFYYYTVPYYTNFWYTSGRHHGGHHRPR